MKEEEKNKTMSPIAVNNNEYGNKVKKKLEALLEKKEEEKENEEREREKRRLRLTPRNNRPK